MAKAKEAAVGASAAGEEACSAKALPLGLDEAGWRNEECKINERKQSKECEQCKGGGCLQSIAQISPPLGKESAATASGSGGHLLPRGKARLRAERSKAMLRKKADRAQGGAQLGSPSGGESAPAARGGGGQRSGGSAPRPPKRRRGAAWRAQAMPPCR